MKVLITLTAVLVITSAHDIGGVVNTGNGGFVSGVVAPPVETTPSFVGGVVDTQGRETTQGTFVGDVVNTATPGFVGGVVNTAEPDVIHHLINTGGHATTAEPDVAHHLINTGGRATTAQPGFVGGVVNTGGSGGGTGGGGFVGGVVNSGACTNEVNDKVWLLKVFQKAETILQACCHWARKGECDNNPIFMKVHCAWACNSCHCTVHTLKTCPTSVDSSCLPLP